jgi:uncharacterized repeat protein (TIGR01451 family)
MSTFFHLSKISVVIGAVISLSYLHGLTCDCPEPDPSVCPPQLNSPPYQPCTFITSANSYVSRYKVNGARGAMTFIGNTLGLSKAQCENEPGTAGNVFDSVGAFTTIDATQTVGSYANLIVGVGSPAGTTLDWRKNSSSAQLNLPVGCIILHAELVWSGSFGYFCGHPDTGNGTGVDPDCVLTPASGPIKFTTPDGIIHLVTADPTTALESQNPAPDVQPYYCAGNYTRSQDVTALLVALTNSNGTYTVGAVPATISAFDDSHNAAGWTLAIVYADATSPFVNNMTLFLGAQQSSRADVVGPAAVDGFCAQTNPGLRSARLLVSAVEGDANISGDHMEFGPTPSNLIMLSGPNNPIDNFFASQINDDQGNLITTTGTFCGFNPSPLTGVLIPNGRQGYDITNVDCSSTISSGQTSAFDIGSTVGDDYMINALGIQISVDSPAIVPIKKVNGALSIVASIGDRANFTVLMQNSGTEDASNVIFQDTLELGLVLVPGSVTLNSVPLPDANPSTGITLGTLHVGDSDLIGFDVIIGGVPPLGTTFVNKGNVSFVYTACIADINTLNISNIVVITLSNDPPAPTDFTGALAKCRFVNKTFYSLGVSWDPVPLPLLPTYEIFKNGKLVATIPATGPYFHNFQLSSKNFISDYVIIANYGSGVKSIPLTIRIK